jgi:hypothetical protein
MCLAAGVPLIESGTTGFNGQVQVIKKVRWICRASQSSNLSSPIANLQRGKRNVTTATRKQLPSPFLSAQSAAIRPNQSTASLGPRAG